MFGAPVLIRKGESERVHIHQAHAVAVAVAVDVDVDVDGDVNDSGQALRGGGRWEGMPSFQRLAVYRCAILPRRSTSPRVTGT